MSSYPKVKVSKFLKHLLYSYNDILQLYNVTFILKYKNDLKFDVHHSEDIRLYINR